MSNSYKVISNHISIGNQLLFTPVLRALKHNRPDALITTDSRILMDLTPELFDEFDGSGREHLVLLPNVKLLSSMKFKGQRTLGFEYRIKGRFVTFLIDKPLRWDWSLHEVENNRKFLDVLDVSDQGFSLDLNPAFDFSKPGKLIGVHPGGRFDKLWPAEYFAAVCDVLIGMGYKVALFGGPEEMALTRLVRFLMKEEVFADYSGLTTLPGVISFIDTCDFFFTNDGGLMHIASALRKPVFAIFGPTDYVKNGPYNEPHWILAQDIDCRPCYHFATIECTNPDKFACLNNLGVEEVLDRLRKRIEEVGL